MSSIVTQVTVMLAQQRRLEATQRENNNDLFVGLSKKNRRKLRRFIKKHKGENIVIEFEHK